MTKNPVLKASVSALAAAALGVGVAACGSSSVAKGIETVPGDGLTQAAVTSTTATATTPTATTPTSGPLATEPTPKKFSGPAPTKLIKKILTAGTGTAIASGDTITANYLGWNYATGVPFSGGSSWTGKHTSSPFTAEIGVGEVIKGWDEGLIGVKAGSRVELIIPRSLAYGTQPKSPLYKDNLVFVIDVLSVTKGGASATSGSAG